MKVILGIESSCDETGVALVADGQTIISEEETGAAKWSGALGEHYVENIGTTPVRLLLIEPKAQ